jgi:hypothetical protein
MMLIPLGLGSAFVGILKQEEPRKYCVIGFVLNLLWFLLPLLGLCAGLVF